MKDEYDFSKAERGKFYRRDMQLIPPIQLDPEVLSYLAERAAERGTSLNALINELLRKDIEVIEAARQAAENKAHWPAGPPSRLISLAVAIS
jgi:hypothetical protein